MNPYMFVIRSIPLPHNKNYRTIRQAIVHVWVMECSINAAQQKALDHIKSLGWNPLKVDNAFSISSELLPRLDKLEADLYQQALSHGISSVFVASPIREKPSESPIEYGEP